MHTDREPLKLAGLCGYAGAGKDTVASLMEKHRNFHPIALADPMYAILAEILNVQEQWLRNNKRTSAEIRRKLQAIGQGCRAYIDSYVWIYALRNTIPFTPPGKIPLITDIRHQNEADFVVHTYNGTLIWVEREGTGPVNDHESEQHYDKLRAMSTHTIHNNGTLEDLEKQVKELTL